MYIENGVQLRELQQFGYLRSGITEFQRTPRLSLIAFALRARIPVSVIVFEDRGTARRADRLIDGSLSHDQFAETAAVDVRYIFQVEQNSIVTLRNFVANRLTEESKRIAGGDLTRQINDKDAIELSRR